MKIVFSLIILNIFSFSQLFSQVPIGQWRAHIANQKGLSLCEAEEKIYCITETGVFYYNKSDNSVQKVGKIEGLSGIHTRSINYHPPTKTVYIGYEDGTIDLIKNDNQITTLSDISRKSYTSKTINEIKVIDDNIYFSTNFGIVVYDPYKLEFKDTYIIGDNGYEIRVNSLADDDEFLYAATEYGVRKAPKDSYQLPNYAEWEKINYKYYSNGDFFPNANGEYNAIAIFQEKIVMNFKQPWAYTYHTYIADPLTQTYEKLNPDTETYTMELKVIDDRLWVIHKNHIGIYDNFTQPTEFYNNTTVSWKNLDISTNDAILDQNNNMWYADENYGLVKSNYNNQSGEYKVPNGPTNNDAFYLSTGDENTWLAAGALNPNGSNTWSPAGLSRLNNGFWESYSSKNIQILTTVRDVIAIEQLPGNPDKIYCSTGTSGVLEMDFSNNTNPEIILHNDTTGSTLKPLYDHIVKVIETHLDNDLNLWAISPMTKDPISVMKTDGTWQDFPYGKTDWDYGKFVIAEDGCKWFIVQRGKGLFLFNEFGTFDELSDDFEEHLDVRDEHGAIISNDLFAITEDKNHYIWLGTQNGVVVYYDPTKVYNENQEGFYGSKIIIDINGKNEHLMEGKKVTAITVDGANQKWIGTEQSGVFLMSPDGTEQILTFNKENSPLPSDNIKSISIDANSGEVFIATSLGLMSYRGEAIEGNEYFKNVYAFPNPVKPEYDGPITIKGLMENTIVKITDISGNLVTEMISLGGQAVWDGKTLHGNRAKTGIYLVFLTEETGEETAVTKILFIN